MSGNFLDSPGEAEKAAALAHVDQAEVLARQVPGRESAVDSLNISQAVVLGAGTMGAGIAMTLANADYRVLLFDRDREALQRGLDKVHATYTSRVDRGRMTEQDAAQRTGLISSMNAFEDVAGGDIIIEAVFEDMDVKKQVFADLGRLAKPDSILATNTSYLDINEIAEAAGEARDRVIGLHFFSPANIMKLLEIVPGDETDDRVLHAAMQLGTALGKTWVVAGICRGFIGNRMYARYIMEAEFLLQEGANVEQVDSALERFGLPMGPFAVRDMAGLDIGWANRKATAHLRDPADRYSTIGDQVCEKGWFGQKTGMGFYRYEQGSRERHPNQELEAIVAASAAEDGIERTLKTDDEIIRRCIGAITDEGNAVLGDGIAQRSSDIDLVWIYGYGFPRWRGGPMYWAENLKTENSQ